MATRHIYLVLAGGGAGGAYIAGVLTGLHQSLDADPTDSEGRSVEIAGIAGASAGALCGALFARTLLDCDGGGLANLRRAWLEVYDIDAIMARPPREVPSQGLFWAEGIIREFREMLDPPSRGAVWARFCAPSLRFAFAATNLDGIPYALPIRGEPRVHAIRHRDALTYLFERGETWEAARDEWIRIREETPASSAFPFFFPPRTIPRRPSDYPYATFPDGARLEKTTFVDGGLFLNEPVDLALALVDGDPPPGGVNDFLLVDPDADYGGYAPPPRPLRLSSLLGRTAAAFRHEAGRGDWMAGRDSVPRLHIARPDRPLAGGFWHGFGGLFSQAWREHDFRVGVADGVEATARILGGEASPPPRPSPLPEHERGPRAISRRTKLRVGVFALRRLWHILGSELGAVGRVVLRPFLFLLLLLNGAAWRLFRRGRRAGPAEGSRPLP